MNSTVVGLFRADITPVDRLLQTTVGRKEMLDDVLEKLGTNTDKKGVQHYVFIGPRGIGKTHFLTLLDNAVSNSEMLRDRYIVLRFPEENNRILSFADMLLGMVKLLGEKVDAEEWIKLYEVQSVNEDDQVIIDTIVPRLKLFRKQSGKMLLVLMENLDILLTQQIKNQQDIHRLRSFLMDSPSITLVGTSPVYFPGLYDIKSPLYDFFDIQVLEDLSENQTIDLIRRSLEWEKREDILKEFDSLVPKIRAIHVMTGGNPRLIMMLYELVVNDNIYDVKIQFQKLLDQISPFYQDRLKDLAPQERALLETIALMRSEPRTPAAIAQKLRKSPQLISSLLQRMTKAGYLTMSENPIDKRSRIYRIKEGFFDLWLAMSESRQLKKRLPYLVDFFNRYYQDQTELQKKREQLWNKLESPDVSEKSKENSREVLEYLSDIGDESAKYVAKLELAVRNLKQGRNINSLEYFDEIESLAPIKPIFQWMKQETEKSIGGETTVDIYRWFNDLIEYWKTQRTGDLEKAAEIAHNLGFDLSNHGLHQIRIELLKDAFIHISNSDQRCSLLLEIAQSQKQVGQIEASLDSLEKALLICKEEKNKMYEGTILNNISQIFKTHGDYEKALEYLEQSLAITKEISNRSGEGTTLNNISQIYYARGDYEKALEYVEQSLAITKEIGNRSGEGAALNNISSVYHARGDYGKALEYLEQSLEIRKEIGDRSGEGATLNNISQIYDERGDYEKALNYLKQSLAIWNELGNPAGFCTTLFNIGHIHFQKKELPQALQAWGQVYLTAKKINLAQTLEALKKLAEDLKLPGGPDAWEELAKKMKKE